MERLSASHGNTGKVLTTCWAPKHQAHRIVGMLSLKRTGPFWVLDTGTVPQRLSIPCLQDNKSSISSIRSCLIQKLKVFSVVGVSASAANITPLARKPSGSEGKAGQTQSTKEHGVRSGIVVVPPRVPCRVRHTSSRGRAVSH